MKEFLLLYDTFGCRCEGRQTGRKGLDEMDGVGQEGTGMGREGGLEVRGGVDVK